MSFCGLKDKTVDNLGVSVDNYGYIVDNDVYYVRVIYKVVTLTYINFDGELVKLKQ